MEHEIIIGKMSSYLRHATLALAEWLGDRLPNIDIENWWEECVFYNLTDFQQEKVLKDNTSSLANLDLAALLKIAKNNWYELMQHYPEITYSSKVLVTSMFKVRNNWAHLSVDFPSNTSIIEDCDILLSFFNYIPSSKVDILDIEDLRDELCKSEQKSSKVDTKIVEIKEIKQNDIICLNTDHSIKGVVLSISEVSGQKKYTVFMDNTTRFFFEDQICLAGKESNYNDVTVNDLCSNLTSYQLRLPATSNLYSLNSAKIDFVPYQFKPALKIIQSDRPRILIADSVGVGKTIESGIIIKELEARSELNNILIVCPRALVSERKWEMEMYRFGEEFVPVHDGAELNNILSSVDRDGEWPLRYSRAIIPYSLLSKRVIGGSGKTAKKGAQFSFYDLQAPPHFDVLIVDEAHHVRNRDTDAYAAIKYLADNSETVIFLTATPIMLGNDDLFTLLNLLRPDLILDKQVFETIGEPNKFINAASKAARANTHDWKTVVEENLSAIEELKWGSEVTSNRPEFKEIREILRKEKVVREDRITLINKLERLNTFSEIINRTRRKDIHDFCIRRSTAYTAIFTEKQQKIYDELLEFEARALTSLHGDVNVAFMMSTIKRQAASCIFGLSKYIDALIYKRLDQIEEAEYVPDRDLTWLLEIADDLRGQIKELPEEDPKYDETFKLIKEKQNQENNKVIVFSSFKHTLYYLYDKLRKTGLRVAMVHGGVKAEDRYSFRQRFALPKEDSAALDILLFTEVGSEGLDYQFCDFMINYDLPWNPMKIEQRIGRIDRRGQLSEAVEIANIITEGTIDAQIYYRCLDRIGVFEESIGDCDAIMGDLTKQIEDIVLDPNLSESEKGEKLEKIADNEIRLRQEQKNLEEQQKQLFGFDLQNFAKDVADAENPWLTADSLQVMLDNYLQHRFGEGTYILKKSEPIKSLRLSIENRNILLEDYNKLPNKQKNMVYREWAMYLKTGDSILPFTLNGEIAEKDHSIVLLSINHPLIRQASEFFNSSKTMNISLKVSGDYQPGIYPFSIYSWDYQGYRPERKLVTVCKNKDIQRDIFQIAKEANTYEVNFSEFENEWKELEKDYVNLWKEEKRKYSESAKFTANTKLASLTSSHKARINILEQQIANSTDSLILRMKQNEKANVIAQYDQKVKSINETLEKIDILSSIVVNGIVKVE